MSSNIDFDIQKYLKKAALIWSEANPSSAKHELVDPDMAEDKCRLLHSRLIEITKHYSNYQKVDDFKNTHYTYCVPEISDDGICSYPDKLEPEPYNLEGVLGKISVANLRLLNTLNDLVEIAYTDLSTDWLGIYRRFQISETPTLVKLAYRGIPSRAEFPITESFAEKSNNSAVALNGSSVIINNLEVHLNKGGVFYVCDEAVKSEACLPIFSTDFSRVLGVVDAEDTKTYAYKSKQLSYLVALCLVLSAVLT